MLDERNILDVKSGSGVNSERTMNDDSIQRHPDGIKSALSGPDEVGDHLPSELLPKKKYSSKKNSSNRVTSADKS